ncbi:vacuolar protein sorting-associated protein 26B-like protein [Cryptococcus deuterogattii 99/473]|uniref:Vacuolar protein sorting-associated protein 26B-like protein n=1 Tax=Cryptococcus deuterogattii Ram5 TaxID=1296110 RepID=A0A0D0V0D1_9TREE|nr:vacuolar protein sorting-associated protein 26B-like protein [Cryptococcus deuterogattii MMRL2647]KIR40926.1 vacuolar protein sorting-associated protein 26B-like protein [Cryptococcus deuterogattii Ram5]KIR97686.1 vacuolar protein sorting-associated protein 26B-like protein [Cryptococcus deuterogattii 2001/935-1]KIY55293.1 vacuolar protein sorting-associated protein 26B-like protein [Cryptococcus deuterogattii 99/473]
MTSLFKFSGSPSEISIKLEGEENRRNVEMKGERGEQELCPVYYDGESVSGRVDMRLKDGRKFQHDGIRIELIGNIVGIEDCLHKEFEYNKAKYHLKDVIVGKIYFLLVRIKIKHMELSIIRRETTGSPPNQYNESETITKFEIINGAPVRGETIPIRLFLGGFEMTPTFRDVNKKISTRYYLNLVLIDEENRRYFKQQEITIFRIP